MLRLALVASALFAAAASAQQVPTLEGRTEEGVPFRLADLRGKVVMLMFWSTGCAVCRDKMAELRQNYQGWKGRPFELVLVSVDAREQDLRAYESLIRQIVPRGQRFIQLWSGDTGYRDNLGPPASLPDTWLLDKNGRVAAHYQGRIPAVAWDQIADLL